MPGIQRISEPGPLRASLAHSARQMRTARAGVPQRSDSSCVNLAREKSPGFGAGSGFGRGFGSGPGKGGGRVSRAGGCKLISEFIEIRVGGRALRAAWGGGMESLACLLVDRLPATHVRPRNEKLLTFLAVFADAGPLASRFEERYCEVAAKRLSQEVLSFE